MSARFVYLGLLGGTDAAVVISDRDHVELRVTARGERSELAVLATSPQAAERVLAVLEDLTPVRAERAQVLALIRRALARTRNLWESLDREAPATPLATLRMTHPRARAMCGHAALGGEPLVPAYGAIIEIGGERVGVRFEGDTVPVIPTDPVAQVQPSRATWCEGLDLSWCDPGVCDVLPECLHGLELPDCGGVDCDPGCL